MTLLGENTTYKKEGKATETVCSVSEKRKEEGYNVVVPRLPNWPVYWYVLKGFSHRGEI
jgi:hypothetical protein